MPLRLFLPLIAVVLVLSGLTVWLASLSTSLALVPALSSVALVVSALVRNNQ